MAPYCITLSLPSYLPITATLPCTNWMYLDNMKFRERIFSPYVCSFCSCCCFGGRKEGGGCPSMHELTPSVCVLACIYNVSSFCMYVCVCGGGGCMWISEIKAASELGNLGPWGKVEATLNDHDNGMCNILMTLLCYDWHDSSVCSKNYMVCMCVCSLSLSLSLSVCCVCVCW